MLVWSFYSPDLNALSFHVNLCCAGASAAMLFQNMKHLTCKNERGRKVVCKYFIMVLCSAAVPEQCQGGRAERLEQLYCSAQ